MSIIPGIVFSRPRWVLIRTRNDTMDREVYLGNDHLVDYRVQERTTGLFTSGLGLTASLSLNPTGSAATSSWFGPPTTSFQSASFATQAFADTTSSGYTESIVFFSSQFYFKRIFQFFRKFTKLFCYIIAITSHLFTSVSLQPSYKPHLPLPVVRKLSCEAFEHYLLLLLQQPVPLPIFYNDNCANILAYQNKPRSNYNHL